MDHLAGHLFERCEGFRLFFLDVMDEVLGFLVSYFYIMIPESLCTEIDRYYYYHSYYYRLKMSNLIIKDCIKTIRAAFLIAQS